MRVQSSFALLVLPLAGMLTLTGCPGPDAPPWASSSCYCDDTGYCSDYDGNQCTSSSPGGGTSGNGGSSSSGFGSSGLGGSSSGNTSSSSGDVSSSSSGNTSSGSSSGNTSSSSGSSGDSDGGTTSSSGGSSGDVDAGPAPNCSTSADCGENQTCSGGFCRFECTTSAECKLHDNRLDTCDQGVCKSQ